MTEPKSPSSKPFVRNTFICPVFGLPKNLCESQLPTYEDVIKCCLNERRNILIETGSKQEPSFSSIAEAVAGKIEKLYQKASIPTVSHQRVRTMLLAYHNKYVDIKSCIRRITKSQAVKDRVETFRHKASTTLFDIASCKCSDISKCTCSSESKVPAKERLFLVDQRSTRLCYIGSVDVIETQKLQKRNKRKLQVSAFFRKEVVSCVSSVNDNDNPIETETELFPGKETYDLYSPSTSKSTPSTSQMRLPLPVTALTSQRYGVSDRAAAAIVSSVLQDVGIISKSNPSLVTDKSKIRREKEKIVKQLQKKIRPDTAFRGLYFDGRKDKTFAKLKEGAKFYRRTITEEHISLVMEPSSQYVGHVTPKSSTAQEISDSIYEYVVSNICDLSELQVIGCDGTVVNTGHKSGIIRRLELKIGRPLQWAICLLHLNELPLRHLFEHVDGPTSGPKSYSGPIGKQLMRCEELPVVKYEPIVCNLPSIPASDLSTDQKYLQELSLAVKSGTCPSDLSKRNPGPLSHSRWLTTANRLLRLYIATANPSFNFKHIVEYLMKVYIPLFFRIKTKHGIDDGPRHVWELVSRSRFLPKEFLEVINPVIARNAFFASPENLLLAMLTDDRAHIRQLAVRRIMKSRETKSASDSDVEVRRFVVPKINLNAKDYIDLIDWFNCEITPPPVLSRVSSEELLILVEEDNIKNCDFSKFPCHTQAVERTVKLVTEASAHVCGHNNRDGYIRSTLKSRNMMPKFDTKSNFNVDMDAL